MEEMDVFRFIVNGKEVETKEDKPLLRFLRDDLKCKSVKTVVVKEPAEPVPF